MLTFDRAVNQVFSTQDTPVKISRSSHVLNGNRWHHEMIYAHAHIRVSVKSLSVSASFQQPVKSEDKEPLLQGAK